MFIWRCPTERPWHVFDVNVHVGPGRGSQKAHCVEWPGRNETGRTLQKPRTVVRGEGGKREAAKLGTTLPDFLARLSKLASPSVNPLSETYSLRTSIARRRQSTAIVARGTNGIKSTQLRRSLGKKRSKPVGWSKFSLVRLNITSWTWF